MTHTRRGCKGNTPAHAGKTDQRGIYLQRCRKYSRARGKDVAGVGVEGERVEILPRTRERLLLLPLVLWLRGNTPAHAGKTGVAYDSHIRFEEILPRTRERLWRGFVLLVRLGNTPAHAGKTSSLEIFVFTL